MAGPTEMSSSLNEKLYLNLYTRVKNSKLDHGSAQTYLRDLIRQVNFHCSILNLTETDRTKFQNDLCMEYYKLTDSVEQEGLLPLSDITNTGISPGKSNGDVVQTMKNYVCELNSHLDNLEISSVLAKLNENNVSRICNTLNNQNNSDKSRSTTLNNNSDKSSPFTLSNKRSISSDRLNSAVHEQPFKKLNRWSGNQKSCIQDRKESAKTSGFISASTMYHNPLKKANENPEISEDKQESSKDSETHESLKHFDKKIVDVIFNEIMDFSPNIKWSDIAGLDFVKTTVQEIVIWPLLRPDIFTGLRAPPRGLLLFGPPGTGKTLIGKCIATESNSTFFCISASSLASKWVGESEQMVRALFTVAHLNQPAVIFIDEIDSLLSQRSDKEQDFSRKLKTEFLVQFDGAKTNSEARVLVVGATNRPHELDEAARRRFVKRLFVPLPDESGRRQIMQKLLIAHQHSLDEDDLQKICNETKGYSGSDMTHLCKEAAMGPIRSIGPLNIKTVSLEEVRPINVNDFVQALCQVRASVAQDDLNYYLEWNKKFGSFVM